nr:hypothetical protein [Paraburkholderia kururiensis]
MRAICARVARHLRAQRLQPVGVFLVLGDVERVEMQVRILSDVLRQRTAPDDRHSSAGERGENTLALARCVAFEHRAQHLRVAEPVRRQQLARPFEKNFLRRRIEERERRVVGIDERVQFTQPVDHLGVPIDVGLEIVYATRSERVDPRFDT